MKTIILLVLLTLPSFLFSQQVADTEYNPAIHDPAYSPGKGPVIFIDEGHFNFHTKNGRYKAFSNLLERDGYNVVAYKDLFKRTELNKGSILVISNALNKINVDDWFLPTPSAFTKSEIDVVKNWVNDGGNLFLIADHMPLAGAAIDLAAAFGFEFYNGFVFELGEDGQRSNAPIIFDLQDKTLNESLITKGRNENETVDQVASFTGQGFKIPNDATPILIFNKNCEIMLPDTAWRFNKKTPVLNVEGWSQGAYRKFGKGKIVVFGEAAMFTAQLAGPQKIKMGMNNEIAPENYQLLLNIIHWLDGMLK